MFLRPSQSLTDSANNSRIAGLLGKLWPVALPVIGAEALARNACCALYGNAKLDRNKRSPAYPVANSGLACRANKSCQRRLAAGGLNSFIKCIHGRDSITFVIKIPTLPCFFDQEARQDSAFRPGKESAKPVRASLGATDQSAAVAQEHQPCELFPIARA